MEQEHVDEIVCGVQGTSEKTQVDRFRSMSGWMGVAGALNLQTNKWKGRTVAKIIEFYIPTKFSKRVKWLPPQERGRVIEFRLPTTTTSL